MGVRRTKVGSSLLENNNEQIYNQQVGVQSRADLILDVDPQDPFNPNC